ncbi:MAG: AarF/ABC1/UbiB kinase family protein [Gemmatimonadetes bacterium]|nr:AarF/ABC1/UbiB kinase family protein [Gemmatimonadota bacterium]
MNVSVSAGPEPVARPVPPPPARGGGEGARIRVRSRIGRTWEILRRLVPFVVAFLRDRRRWILFGAARRLPVEAHQARARRIVDAIAELGPTFIKLVQVFSSRADIIPEPYLSELARLHDAVPAVPVEAIDEVIREELGRPAHELFERFDRIPLAAASLGQVHRATCNGEEVAVKVIRPGVERLVALDLDISFRILFLLNILFPNHHVRALSSVVREFDRRIHEELDLRQEAANTEIFRQRFAEEPRVRVPRVIQEFTRRRVLVTEFIHGTKVDRLHAQFASGELSFPRMLDTLSEAYMRMMLVDGMLHADPHPGNILVQDDGTVVFLDFGMIVQVERSTRERLFRLGLAAARDDVDGIINVMYELGMIDPEISRAEIRTAAVRIMEILERARELSHRRVQEMVQEIFDTFYTWPLILPEELVYFLRAMVLLEGIGFRYDADFNGLEVAKPVIQRMRGELLQALRKEPGDLARGVVEELQHTVRALHDLVLRAEREELRLRTHPADVLHQERIAALLVRRLLLGLFASVMAMVATLVFVATRSWVVLLIGNAAALFLFFLVLVIPKHLLENPLRHGRGVRRRGHRSA